MTTFTIDADNNITAHASATEAKALAGTERFGNEAALAKLAANWTAARLVEIYNSLTGVTPVKKFKDRNTGAARIWSNIQNLASEPDATATPAAQQAPAVAPEQAPAKNKATRGKKAPVAKEAKGARAGSKTETILALMKQPGGTTLNAIMEATQWQAHSVRGFISGTLGKKMGLNVLSTKSTEGERTYSIQA
jgi:hypothetical protein